MVEAVIFDLDGVLCDYDRADRLRRLSALCGLAPEEIEARIFTSGFDDEADRGAYDLEEYCRLTCEKLETELGYDALIAARLDAMRRKEDVIAVVRALSGQVRLALLTNNGPFLAHGIARILPEVDELFAEHAYFSGVLGLAKPAPAAFEEVAARLGAAPARTLFIDDWPEYLAGAATAGLITHHYQSTPALTRFLTSLGLRV